MYNFPQVVLCLCRIRWRLCSFSAIRFWVSCCLLQKQSILFTFIMILFINILKRLGLRPSPCLMLTSTSTLPVKAVFVLVQVLLLEYESLITMNMFHQYFRVSGCQWYLLIVLWLKLVRSRKYANKGVLYSINYCISWRTINIASSVLDLLRQKPCCFSQAEIFPVTFCKIILVKSYNTELNRVIPL